MDYYKPPSQIYDKVKGFMKKIRNIFNTKQLLNETESKGVLIEIDETLRKELQAALLLMLEDIYSVCRKNKIRMFLSGGTALGAIRHQGFIPWDDDVDIAMTRHDYNKFCSVFEEELSDRYILSAPNYNGNAKARFPKILKKGTYLEEILDSTNKDLCKLFLDIFILENAPENKYLRRLRGSYCNTLEAISGMVSFVERADDTAKAFYKSASRVNYYSRCIIGKLFSFKKAEWWFDRVDHACNYRRKSSIVCFPTGRKHYFGEILEKEKLFPLIKVSFDGKSFPVFSGYDYYLTNLYGDYMKIPPVEKREKHFVKKLLLNTDERV